MNNILLLSRIKQVVTKHLKDADSSAEEDNDHMLNGRWVFDIVDEIMNDIAKEFDKEMSLRDPTGMMWNQNLSTSTETNKKLDRMIEIMERYVPTPTKDIK